MADAIININADEFVELTNKLEKIGRADMPVAVRSTLNNLAFDMKGTSSKRGMIDRAAEKEFDYRRNKTLFRAMTGVTKAKGLDIKSMSSASGIVSKPGRNEVAEGLADQQTGGTTKQKATPLKHSRTSKNVGKKVRKPARLQNLNSIDLRNKKGQRFHAGAISAKKTKRTVLIEGRGGTKLIARVRSFKRTNRSVSYKMDFLYRINDNGNVSLKRKRPFITRAAAKTMTGMPDEFVKQANKRINKTLKK